MIEDNVLRGMRQYDGAGSRPHIGWSQPEEAQPGMTTIACYSNKGGVGKTAAAVNLAHAWAQSGARTLLCDLDPQGASSFYFGAEPTGKFAGERFFKDVERFTREIRRSNHANLDILPAHTGFRDFDVFLSRMTNSGSRLKKALKAVGGDYDMIVLDCPPNVSTLSGNVFRAAKRIVVPVIPTTLSERSFDQLVDLFRDNDLNTGKLMPFFSMVEARKRLHRDTMDRMRETYRKLFLDTVIPASADVERMGVKHAPVAAFAPNRPAGRAYRALWAEIDTRLGR